MSEKRVLKTDNLHFQIHGHDIIKPEDDILIQENQHCLLIGPSGCGKTTLLNLLTGLKTPNKGEIQFQDKAYSNLSSRQIDALRAKHFGFVFQTNKLISYLSVYQNVALSLSAARQKNDKARIMNLLEKMGIADKARQKARTLSEGEAQRTAIARAVVHKPDIIFADEPTSALDDANTEKVIELLFNQAKENGATLVVSTHDARINPYFKTIKEMRA